LWDWYLKSKLQLVGSQHDNVVVEVQDGFGLDLVVRIKPVWQLVCTSPHDSNRFRRLRPLILSRRWFVLKKSFFTFTKDCGPHNLITSSHAYVSRNPWHIQFLLVRSSSCNLTFVPYFYNFYGWRIESTNMQTKFWYQFFLLWRPQNTDI